MTADAVARAKGEYQDAIIAERELQTAVVNGDTTVTASDLAEAEAAVRLAALRVQAAERLARQEADREYERKQEARRQRAKAQAQRQRQVEREGWQRSIESGAAWRRLQALRSEGSTRPRFDPEYREMLIDAGLLKPDGTVADKPPVLGRPIVEATR